MSDRPKPLGPVEAYEFIQELLATRDSIAYTSHVRDRMRQRHFTIDDIRRVLLFGTVAPNPEWKDSHQQWVYTIAGVDYDNEPLAIVVALEPALNRITVITGHDV